MKLTKHIFRKLTRVFDRRENDDFIDSNEIVIDGVLIKKEKEEEKELKNNSESGINFENKKEEKEENGKVSDSDLINGFCSHLESSGFIKSSVIGYRADLKVWMKFSIENNVTLETMSILLIEKFLKGKDVDTARRKIASLRGFAKWRLRNDVANLFLELQKLKFKAKKIRVPKSIDFLDYKRIIEQSKEMAISGERKGLWLCLICVCGLRIHEIRNAKADLRTGFIRILGKGNKERLVSCPRWLLDAMKKIKKEEYQKSRQYIDKELKKIGYQRFHKFRHTYATKLLREGVPIDKIKDLLGHSSISTTQIYLKTEVLENAHEFIEK